MNRFAFGLSLLAFVPLSGGCGLYITAPPTPAPIPPPAKKPLQYPFDATQGIGLAGAPTDKGLALNGAPRLPTSFRAADVVFAPRSSSDTANYTPLLVLQSTSTDAQGNVIPSGTADVNNPVRLAGVIVPAPNTPGYEEALQATRNWAQGQPGALGAKPAPGAAPVRGTTPLAIASARPGQVGTARGTATISVAPPTGASRATTGTRATAAGAAAAGSVAATPATAYIASQALDVYEDPKYPIDSENRRLVQVFFKSVNATKAVPAGTLLSLGRMLIRSGWAVVDLYSPTAFDQQSWLLDESYARGRKLGLWRYGVALQQRLPEISTGTGALSSIPVVVGASGTGAVASAGRTQRGSTPAAFPRVVAGSGSRVQRGRSNTAVLPPPSDATAPSTTSSGSTLGGSSAFGGAPGSGPGRIPGGPPSSAPGAPPSSNG